MDLIVFLWREVGEENEPIMAGGLFTNLARKGREIGGWDQTRFDALLGQTNVICADDDRIFFELYFVPHNEQKWSSIMDEDGFHVKALFAEVATIDVIRIGILEELFAWPIADEMADLFGGGFSHY